MRRASAKPLIPTKDTIDKKEIGTMKTERIYPAAVVTKKAEASLKKGHPWVYDTEIKSVKGESSKRKYSPIKTSEI